MKKIIFCFLFLGVIACSKTSSLTHPTPSPNCKIVTATLGTGSNIIKYTFTYDANGRVSTLVYDAPDAYSKTYSYDGNNINMAISAGIHSSTDTVIRDGAGKILTHIENIPPDSYHTAFSYNSSGELESSTDSKNGNPSSTTAFHFVGGDLINNSTGTETDTMTYYADQPSVIGNLVNFYQLVYQGTSLYNNKHLLKSLDSYPYHFDYTYTFDTDGKILTATETSATSSTTTTFTYNCN